MEELSDEMDGEVDFFSADVDENRDLAYQFDIQSIPAIVVFANGEEVTRTVGFPTAKAGSHSGKNGAARGGSPGDTLSASLAP